MMNNEQLVAKKSRDPVIARASVVQHGAGIYLSQSDAGSIDARYAY